MDQKNRRPKSPADLARDFEEWGSELEARLAIMRHLGIPKDATEREIRFRIEEWAFEVVGVGRDEPKFTPLRLLARAQAKGLIPRAGDAAAAAVEPGTHAALLAKLDRHIASGKGYATYAEFYRDIGIDEADWGRWKRQDRRARSAGYSRRIEHKIRGLPE